MFGLTTPNEGFILDGEDNSILVVMDSKQQNKVRPSVCLSCACYSFAVYVCVWTEVVSFLFEPVHVGALYTQTADELSTIRHADGDQAALGGRVCPHGEIFSQIRCVDSNWLALDPAIFWQNGQKILAGECPKLIDRKDGRDVPPELSSTQV